MTTQTVLLVDDEPDILQLLEITLARMNLQTRRALSVTEAHRLLESEEIDLCLTDMKLPDGNGLHLIQHIQTHYPHLPVAMITAHGSVESAIDALKLGAFDFLSKPLALDKLRGLVSHALNIKPASVADTEELIGTAAPMVALRDQVRKVALSQAPIHITGESGVGKEVVAKLIHKLSPRNGKPFIAVNCGAIPPELVESELFGHVKGAFTGATADKQGLFQAAAGGTLLLDEVADLPLTVQVKLLRAIQEKAVRPVGGESEIATDVRLLSATHKDLAIEVREGRFRDDLFYRIHVIALEVPPLRERREDIQQLAQFLLGKLSREQQHGLKTLSEGALNKLLSYDFPGNIRELENTLARACALADTAILQAQDIKLGFGRGSSAPEPSSEPATTADDPVHAGSLSVSDQEQVLAEVNGDLEGYLENLERQILNAALIAHRWNKTATAKALGISFRSLRYRLKKRGLEE